MVIFFLGKNYGDFVNLVLYFRDGISIYNNHGPWFSPKKINMGPGSPKCCEDCCL